MGTSWIDALRRAATALGRRRRMADDEGSELTDESGFTLIELMVVLLIMGILMAIAIPTFLGVTSTANDTSTQSNLTNVITSAKAIYAKADAYATKATGAGTSTKMATELKADEPEFTYKKSTVASTKQSVISVDVATATKLVVAAYMTKTKECWFAEDTNAASTTAGVKYGYYPPAATAKTVASTKCKAASFASVTNWTTKWPAAPTGH